MKMKRIHIILVLVSILSGCATNNYKPVTNKESIFGKTEDEIELIKRADKMHQDLDSKGYILHDPDLQAYIERIKDKVVPISAYEKLPIDVFILNDSDVNAFAIPNGNIYLYSGLISKLENEAQLAFLIGHEAAHVIQRHSINKYKSTKNKMKFANTIVIAPYGGIVSLGTISNILYHSRADEEEADSLGITYARNAGYDVTSFKGLFKRLKLGRPSRNKSSVWSTHPTLDRRIKFVEQYISEHEPQEGIVNHDDFDMFRHKVVKESISAYLIRKQYLTALDNIDQELEHDVNLYQAKLHFLKGEVYRGMAKNPERVAKEYSFLNDKRNNEKLIKQFQGKEQTYVENAKSSYNEALKLNTNLTVTYRGLGMLAYQQQDYTNALKYLKTYLKRHTGIMKDKRYINRIIEELTNA